MSKPTKSKLFYPLLGILASWILVYLFAANFKLQNPIVLRALVVRRNNTLPHAQKPVKSPKNAIISTPTPTVRPQIKSAIEPVKKYLTVDASKVREKVLAMASKYYSGDELIALDNLIKSESGWRVDAVNSIGACGLGQAYPCAKMNCPLDASGVDCQFQFVVGYLNSRYGSPIVAWNFKLNNGWY